MTLKLGVVVECRIHLCMYFIPRLPSSWRRWWSWESGSLGRLNFAPEHVIKYHFAHQADPNSLPLKVSVPSASGTEQPGNCATVTGTSPDPLPSEGYSGPLDLRAPRPRPTVPTWTSPLIGIPYHPKCRVATCWRASGKPIGGSQIAVPCSADIFHLLLGGGRCSDALVSCGMWHCYHLPDWPWFV